MPSDVTPHQTPGTYVTFHRSLVVPEVPMTTYLIVCLDLRWDATSKVTILQNGV